MVFLVLIARCRALFCTMAVIRVTRIHTTVERGGSKRRPWTRGLEIAHVPLFREFLSVAGFWVRSSAAGWWPRALDRTRLHGGRYSYISVSTFYQLRFSGSESALSPTNADRLQHAARIQLIHSFLFFT